MGRKRKNAGDQGTTKPKSRAKAKPKTEAKPKAKGDVRKFGPPVRVNVEALTVDGRVRRAGEVVDGKDVGPKLRELAESGRVIKGVVAAENVRG